MDQDSQTVTELLERASSGDQNAEQSLLDAVYLDLHRIAGNCMRHERKDHTLQPTALIHEAYRRIRGQEPVTWKNRLHFYCVAARVMRRVLIDHARQRKASKRSHHLAVEMDWREMTQLQSPCNLELMLSVDEALDRLAAVNARQARVVEMRFFAGMNEEEIGAALQVCTRTVKRDWFLARAWLHRELSA